MRLPSHFRPIAVMVSALAILVGTLTIAILTLDRPAHGAPVSPGPAASASAVASPAPSASTVPPSPADSRPAPAESSSPAPATPGDRQQPLSTSVLAAIVVGALVLLGLIAYLMLRGRSDSSSSGVHRH